MGIRYGQVPSTREVDDDEQEVRMESFSLEGPERIPPRSSYRHYWPPRPGRFCLFVSLSAGLFLLLLMGILRASSNRRSSSGFGQQLVDPSVCRITVLLLRHCEKTDSTAPAGDDGHCSALGHERAVFLTTLFNNNHKSGSKWPEPDDLYALTFQRKGHKTFRQYETLFWLGQKTGKEIQFFASNQELARSVMQDLSRASSSAADRCGRLIVVSWKHSFMRDLVQKLGCTDDYCPKKWKKLDFDSVWELQYIYQAPATNKEMLHAEDKLMGNVPPVLASDDESTDGDDESSDDDDGHDSRRRYRAHSNKNVLPRGWSVYPIMTQQGFDPLSFHNSFGGKYHSP